MRRRELLVGLVGVTGTAVFGAAARPATARAAAVVQELPPQLTGALQPVGVQVLAGRLAAARVTFQACRYQELAGICPV